LQIKIFGQIWLLLLIGIDLNLPKKLKHESNKKTAVRRDAGNSG
jgi:hypothetical protein